MIWLALAILAAACGTRPVEGSTAADRPRSASPGGAVAATSLTTSGGGTATPTASPTASPPPTPPPPPDPTRTSIPTVIAAVQLARRGGAIPWFVPPLGQIMHDQFPPIPDCWGLRHDPGFLDRCTLLGGGDAGTIVLIGDSHARQWLTPITWFAERDGWAVIPFWKGGCWPAAYHSGGECQSMVEWAVEQVREIRPDVVLVGGAFRFQGGQDSIDRTRNGIAWLIPELAPYAGDVMVIGDPPSLEFLPEECLGAPGARLADCTRTLSADQITVYLVARRAANTSGATFLNTIGWYCWDMQCPAVVAHKVTYRVADHITRTYAFTLRYRLRAAFQRALAT